MAVNRKEAIEIGLIIFALIVLIWFARRNTSVAVDLATATQQKPNLPIEPGRNFGVHYWDYNFPLVEGNPAYVGVNPLTPLVNTGLPTCGCSSGSEIMFAGLNDFENQLQAKLTNIVDKYSANVLSVLPTYFTQYFENAGGTALSSFAAQEFGGGLPYGH